MIYTSQYWVHEFNQKGCTIIRDIIQTSYGLSKDFAGSGQNWVTAKNQVRAGSSYSAERNITVAKFN